MKIPSTTTFVLLIVALSAQNDVLAEQEQPQQGTLGSGGLLGQLVSGVVSLLAPNFDDIVDRATALASAATGATENTNTNTDSETTGDATGGGLVGQASGNLQFISCTQSTTCFNDSTQTPGAWTCRPQIVGDISVCVPTLLGVTVAREGDTCGCCEGVCPVKCQCGCTNARGTDGVMARFSLFFGLLQFEQCLEPTVADAATSFTTLDISCSETCMQVGGGDV